MHDAISYTEAIRSKKECFPKPSPPLRTMDSLISKLDKALSDVKLPPKVKTHHIHFAVRQLIIAVKQLGSYVETLANKNPDRGLVYVQEAHMRVKKQSTYRKHIFTMRSGPSPGQITLTALAGLKMYSMNFQITTTPDKEESWKSVQQKTRSSVTVGGLMRGALYYGRCLRTDDEGTFQYGQIESAGVP